MSSAQMNLLLYQQIAGELLLAINRGHFPPGQRLPSIRQMSQSRSVSINTILAAYSYLEEQGVIISRPQAGFFVCARLPEIRNTKARHMLVAPPKAEVLDLIEIAFSAQQDPQFTNISLACPQDGDFYPHKKLARILNQLLRKQPSLIGSYSLPPGSLRLRQQIARRALSLGMTLDHEEVILTHGCMEALQLALRIATQPGDCIGLESPTYFQILPLLSSLGLNAIEIPTDPQQGVSLDAVEKLLQQQRVQALLLMPNGQNPLGCTMPLQSKKRLAQLVNHYRVPLIEDGLYTELAFSNQPPAVKSFDREGWIIFCTSFSKTLAPDFRVGWMCGGRFSRQLSRLKTVSSMSEPKLLLETLGLFLESGGYDQHLRTLRRRYAHQVQEARGLIARYFPQGTRATEPQSGFLFWVELPEQIETEMLFHQALAEQICLLPGKVFSPGGHYSNCFRLSCCYPFNERYINAIKRVGELACALAESGRQSSPSRPD
ncbi:MAG: PLP-dependent aminotransferase family protein [Enterobacteriaceae bacterium]